MNIDHVKTWTSCLALIKDNITAQAFKTWFEPIVPVKIENNILTIQVPSHFFYEWLEEHYITLLSRVIKKEIGQEGSLEYSILMESNHKNAIPYTVKLPTQNNNSIRNMPVSVPINNNEKQIRNPFIIPGLKKINIESNLMPQFTLDNFVEGDCNRLARASGYAIANKPGGTAFNPLLIYGAVGLGKTHLANAIGIAIKEKQPAKTVLYVQSEKFAHQFIDAIKNQTTNDFVHFYQMIDVLIIDGMEQRLLSRFKWGLSADLSIPDLETRIAVLHKKMHGSGIELPKEVVEYLAYSINTNIREIEGALNTLLAQASLNKKAITLELAKQMVDKFVKNTAREVSIEYIQKVVCDYFDLPIEMLKSKTRKREVVQARQISMYFSKKMTKSSLANIGAHCGGKDHATVLHACRTVVNLSETDKQFKIYLEDLEKKLTLQ